MSSAPKPFQISTAEAAVRTLTGKGRRRFLVADEVGLGKTVVASQVILGMARKYSGQLTVFYVTSGRTVAGQNKGRLLDFGNAEPITGEVSSVDRLGLIPSEHISSNLRLYAFSPLTSFPATAAKASLGQVRERAFLYQLVLATYPQISGKLPIDPFRGRAQRMWPAEYRRSASTEIEISSKLRAAFRTALKARLGKGVEAKIIAAADAGPAAFMTDLRLALAHAALILSKPDLVIFDEFQCYRDLLLGEHSGSDHVRRALIEGSGERPPAMLLLSATPFRLADDVKAKGTTAHAEFHELLGFLGGTSLRTRSEQLLGSFRHLLSEIAKAPVEGAPPAVIAETHAVRASIEALLAPIMSRTERDDPGNDLERATRSVETGLKSSDLDTFRALAEGVSSEKDGLDRTGSRSDALAYWLSVPLAAQALGPSYKFWTRGDFKNAATVPKLTRSNRYTEPRSGWGSPKLRGLSTIVDTSGLALPWAAPSLPWWELGALWRNHGQAPKALVFSKFRATPQSIASLMSLEVERRHLKSKGYEKAWLSKRLASRTNTIFNLFHVSPFLVSVVDPLAAPCRTEDDVRSLARRQLKLALNKLGISTRIKRKIDARRHRPSWRILAAIENAATYCDHAKPDINAKFLRGLLDDAARQLRSDDPRTVDQIQARNTTQQISWVSPNELADLVDLAIGSPAVVTARAISRHFSDWTLPKHYCALVSMCWGVLRKYLDNPIFWSTLPGRDIEPQICRAIIAGGFEALLDEHIWTRKASLTLDKLIIELSTALGLGTGSFTFQDLPKSDKGVGVRCHAALPFAGAQADTTRPPSRKKSIGSGDKSDEAEGPARSETIREAFNTPFWPHLLSTTSVGQEGLDFHIWCDQVVHWDLCSSPVDLEQREGRIQRFASLTIRRALALKEGSAALAAAIGNSVSPWIEVKRLAERNHSDDAGLSPWWTLPNAHVRRYVFSLPGGRDVLRFRKLQDQRFLYRLALGQPNPEDFIASLSNEGAAERLKPFLLNLSAFSRSRNGGDPD